VDQGGRTALLSVVGAGFGGLATVSLCPTSPASATATAYFYDHYPTSALDLGQPPSFGAMAAFTASTLDCCKAQGVANVAVQGALAIKITNNNADFLHLTEVQVSLRRRG
jgi:hypothetical protein